MKITIHWSQNELTGIFQNPKSVMKQKSDFSSEEKVLSWPNNQVKTHAISLVGLLNLNGATTFVTH